MRIKAAVLSALLLLLFTKNAFAVDASISPNLSLRIPAYSPGTWGEDIAFDLLALDALFPGGVGTQIRIQDEGSNLNFRPTINFTGPGVNCGDNVGLSRTDCTISAGGGGSPVVLDLNDDAANESTSITEIATVGDTNSIFTEPIADKLLIDVSKKWPVAGTADALTANGANCSAGQAPLGVSATGAAESCTDYMEEPGSNGLVAKTAANTSAARTLQDQPNVLTWTFGNGVSGNPTPAIATPLIDGSIHYCLDTGSVNVIQCNLVPAPSGYVTGATYRVKLANTITGATTANFNSLGAKSAVKVVGGITTALVANDGRVGQILDLTFDGTNLQLQSTLGNAGSGSVTGSGTANKVAIFTSASVIGDSTAYSEDADSANISKKIEVGTGPYAIFDTSAIASTDKTITVPNANSVIPIPSTASGTGSVVTHIDSAGNQQKALAFSGASWDAGAITPDGTNCTDPTKVTINSGPVVYKIACADLDTSIMYGQVRLPVAINTATFTLTLNHGTTETITFAGSFSAECRAPGTTVDATWGTGQTANVAITTANQDVEATSAAVTPNGTCSAGSMLFWRYVVSAAGFSTNAANARVLGVTMLRAS